MSNCKQCKKCEKVYPIKSFYKQRSAKDGHFGTCRFCESKRASARSLARRLADPEGFKERARLYKRIYRARDKEAGNI